VVAVRKPTGLADDLETLALFLGALDLTTDLSLERERDRLVRTIRSYLIPRLMVPGRPLTVVFAGPTGSGKSTLVNSLAGLEVSATGPIRPTTREPVVLASERFAPELGRIGGADCQVVTGSAPILDQVSLVDTPDIDSTARQHRMTAEVLIDNADVVVFVTSALRYADATPWEVLRRAQSRGAPLLFVLNRVTPESTGAYLDFTRRLRAVGLDQVVLRVPEHRLSVAKHAVPALAVRDLRRQLEALARDNVRKGQEILDRVLAASINQASDLIAAVDDFAAELDVDAESVREIFSHRFAHLDLSGSVLHLPEEAPARHGGWSEWRWRRANRLTPQAAAAIRLATTEIVARAVESDIGRAAIEARADPGTVMAVTRPVIREALSGWMKSLDSFTAGVRRSDRPLACLSLLQMVVASSGMEAGGILFGVDSDAVIRRARSALIDRMEVAYAHAAEVAVGGSDGADLDTRLVADALAAVVVRSHFADA
jgi:energy-coupling factor transporter ATP-binding protein EcfA2